MGELLVLLLIFAGWTVWRIRTSWPPQVEDVALWPCDEGEGADRDHPA